MSYCCIVNSQPPPVARRLVPLCVIALHFVSVRVRFAPIGLPLLLPLPVVRMRIGSCILSVIGWCVPAVERYENLINKRSCSAEQVYCTDGDYNWLDPLPVGSPELQNLSYKLEFRPFVTWFESINVVQRIRWQTNWAHSLSQSILEICCTSWQMVVRWFNLMYCSTKR